MVIERGDVVRLESGGPEMTVDWVQELSAGNVIHVKWFDPYDMCQEGRFRVEMLRRLKDN